jgi:hypothetical protein
MDFKKGKIKIWLLQLQDIHELHDVRKVSTIENQVNWIRKKKVTRK